MKVLFYNGFALQAKPVAPFPRYLNEDRLRPWLNQRGARPKTDLPDPGGRYGPGDEDRQRGEGLTLNRDTKWLDNREIAKNSFKCICR